MVLLLFLCNDLSLKLLDTLLFLCFLACDLETISDELSKPSSHSPSFVERLGYLGDDVVKVMLCMGHVDHGDDNGGDDSSIAWILLYVVLICIFVIVHAVLRCSASAIKKHATD